MSWNILMICAPVTAGAVPLIETTCAWTLMVRSGKTRSAASASTGPVAEPKRILSSVSCSVVEIPRTKTESAGRAGLAPEAGISFGLSSAPTGNSIEATAALSTVAKSFAAGSIRSRMMRTRTVGPAAAPAAGARRPITGPRAVAKLPVRKPRSSMSGASSSAKPETARAKRTGTMRCGTSLRCSTGLISSSLNATSFSRDGLEPAAGLRPDQAVDRERLVHLEIHDRLLQARRIVAVGGRVVGERRGEIAGEVPGDFQPFLLAGERVERGQRRLEAERVVGVEDPQHRAFDHGNRGFAVAAGGVAQELDAGERNREGHARDADAARHTAADLEAKLRGGQNERAEMGKPVQRA